MVLKKYKIPIYGGQLWVCVTKSFTGAVEHIENTVDTILDSDKDDLRRTAAVAYQFYLPDGKFRILVMIKPRASVNDIVHESLHMVNWIFLHTNTKYSLTNDEPQCYLLGWVCDRVLRTKNQHT